jgi:hypothetical protein
MNTMSFDNTASVAISMDSMDFEMSGPNSDSECSRSSASSASSARSSSSTSSTRSTSSNSALFFPPTLSLIAEKTKSPPREKKSEAQLAHEATMTKKQLMQQRVRNAHQAKKENMANLPECLRTQFARRAEKPMVSCNKQFPASAKLSVEKSLDKATNRSARRNLRLQARLATGLAQPMIPDHLKEIVLENAANVQTSGAECFVISESGKATLLTTKSVADVTLQAQQTRKASNAYSWM